MHHNVCLCIWPGPSGFQIRSRIDALREHNIELVSGCKPFPDITTAFLEVADGEIDQLGRCLLGRERTTRLDGFADHPGQARDRNCRLYDFLAGVQCQKRFI